MLSTSSGAKNDLLRPSSEAARSSASSWVRSVPDESSSAPGWALWPTWSPIRSPFLRPDSAFSTIHRRGPLGPHCRWPLGEVPVVRHAGRVHFYEGYSPQQVTFPMRVLARSAPGGHPDQRRRRCPAGLPRGPARRAQRSHQLHGLEPAGWPNEPRFAARPGAGLRFFDMTEAYSKPLRALAHEAAKKRILRWPKASIWPSAAQLRDPAEIRAFRALGATLSACPPSRRPSSPATWNRCAGHLLRHQPGRRAGAKLLDHAEVAEIATSRAPPRPAAQAARAKIAAATPETGVQQP